MRVAIAGSGDLCRYLCEELPRQGHDVVVLSRSNKSHLDSLAHVEQRITDYASPESLLTNIQDCEALVSTILDYSAAFIDVHLKLIEACTKSPRCKKFIPSEFSGNAERFPNQPGFYFRTREPIRQKLRGQAELQWTIVCVGWLADYVAPARNRYLSDIGAAFPLDLAAGTMTIPGDGDNVLDVTWCRDVATGLGALLKCPEWEPYTYMSGQQVSWNSLAGIVAARGSELTVKYTSVAELEQMLATATDEKTARLAEFQLFSAGPAGEFSSSTVAKHREKYLSGIHFRDVAEGLDTIRSNRTVIV